MLFSKEGLNFLILLVNKHFFASVSEFAMQIIYV